MEFLRNAVHDADMNVIIVPHNVTLTKAIEDHLLDRINRIGTTVVMATHDNAIVDAMRRRVIELDGGKIVRDQSRGVYGYGT